MGRRKARRSRWLAAFVALLASLCVAAGGAGSSAAAQDTPVPGGAAELLKFAPEGAWAEAAMDFKALLASPLFAGIKAERPDAWERMKGVESAALFILPMEPPLDKYPGALACGLVRLAEGRRATLEAGMAKMRRDQDVAGLPAYGREGVVLVFIDDNTMAFGVDANAAAAVVTSYRSGGSGGTTLDLKEIVQPHAGRSFHAGMVLPVPLGKALSEAAAQGMPEPLKGLTAGAVGLDLAPGLALQVHLRFADAVGPQLLLAMVQSVLAEARKNIKAGMESRPMQAAVLAPLAALLDKPKLSAEGADFRAGLDLTPEELKASQGAVAMLFMMASQAASRGRSAAEVARSESNLRIIGLTLQMYADDHEGHYPPDLAALFDAGFLDDDKNLIDPADTDPQKDQKSGRPCSYVYAGTLPPKLPPNFIVCYSRKGIHKGLRVVLYADGAVATVSEDDLHKPGAARGMSLWDCYRWAADNWPGELVYDNDARLQEFFEVAD